jgi:riboflavin kinase / FMN adenylyltransferase
MKLFKINKHAQSLKSGSVLTIGNFDGVHIGHQALLKWVISRSQQLNLPSVVVIFEPHPKELFLKHLAPKRIFTLREKIYYLKQMGIDYIFCIQFTDKIAKTSAQEFIQHILLEKLQMRFIMIGHDFHFGKDRLGNKKLLQELANDFDFKLEIFDDVETQGQRISSTGVRHLISEQNLDHILFWLGRHYSIIGRVIVGQKLARQLGTPTANIAINTQRLTLSGVFCVKIKICGQNQLYSGVANIGYRPTVNGSKLFLEVHLFDWYHSLYGQFLEVSFLKKIRNEQKFANLEALRKQIEDDIVCAKLYFDKIN